MAVMAKWRTEERGQNATVRYSTRDAKKKEKKDENNHHNNKTDETEI